MQRATINRSPVTIIGILLAEQSTIDVSYVAFVEVEYTYVTKLINYNLISGSIGNYHSISIY